MNKAAIGKRNEFQIWAWLIEEGLDVYPSLVDDKGIDGLVGNQNGKYFEVQIKSGKNWNNQRGLKKEILEKNPNRVFVIFNYIDQEIRYFTGQDILNEPDWAESITWNMSQIKLTKLMLKKYQSHDWYGLVRYLKT